MYAKLFRPFTPKSLLYLRLWSSKFFSPRVHQFTSSPVHHPEAADPADPTLGRAGYQVIAVSFQRPAPGPGLKTMTGKDLDFPPAPRVRP